MDSPTHAPAEEHSGWQPVAGAAAACAALLAVAYILEDSHPQVAVAAYLASFAAGFRYTLPETSGQLAEGQIDVDFLMILVALGAWALGHPGEGALLLVLFNASRAMEAYARQRTRSAVGDLLKDLPRRAVRLRAGAEEEVVDVGVLVVGDRLRIRPGERFPVDVRVREGSSGVDLSAINGEAEPRLCTPGSEVPSGGVNGMGMLEVEVLRPATESAFQKIIALIESAPSRRSPAQELADRAGKWFTWVILSTASLGFLVWWQGFGLTFQEAGYRAMALLVAGSPCAIVLSIPSAVLAAISFGARHGLLINGGAALAALAGVRRVAFDKTGTLSTGEPGVVRVLPEAGAADDVEEYLGLAEALARSSTHPASQALLRYFERTNPARREPEGLSQIVEEPGRGMSAVWKGTAVHLGRARGCDALDASDPELSRVLVYAAGRPVLRFLLSENPRPQAAETVVGLRTLGVDSLIISGDVKPAVERMARLVGVTEAHGEVSPDQKYALVTERAAQPGGVLMLGDGVNDAPALAAATVGAAMGIRGSAATLAQADIILVRDRLPDLVEAVRLARRTRAVVQQNLAIAIGAASLLVLTALLGHLPLSLGVLGHEGGTVLVVLNSLRLLLEEPGGPAPALVTDRVRQGTA